MDNREILSRIFWNLNISLRRLSSRAKGLNVSEFTSNVASNVEVEDRGGARTLEFVLFTAFVFVH